MAGAFVCVKVVGVKNQSVTQEQCTLIDPSAIPPTIALHSASTVEILPARENGRENGTRPEAREATAARKAADQKKKALAVRAAPSAGNAIPDKHNHLF